MSMEGSNIGGMQVSAPPPSHATLTGNERWVADFEGKYAVSIDGRVISFARGKRKLLKARIKGHQLYVKVFFEDEAHYWKVANLVAEAFLETEDFLFADGDTTNARLSNLRRKVDMVAEGEIFLEGFDGVYSVTKDGNVISYKQHVRKVLKPCHSLAKSLRVCLSREGEQFTVYLDGLMEKYFGTTLSAPCTLSLAI